MDAWHIGANDPDVLGWLMTVAYLVASGLCWLCGTKARQDGVAMAHLRQRVWWLFAVLVLLLGVNKQLDLQTPLLACARNLARTEGWYRERRVVQWVSIGATVVCGVVLLGWLAWRVRAMWREFCWAFAGLVLLLGFVAIRAAPVELDAVLGIQHRVPGKRHMLELAGILCVVAATVVHLLKRGARNAGQQTGR